ncbi:hypothetical protein RGQ21_15080 [Kitasatospora aureofaciens]|nr:hypothetical protein RGQ21_15080 [Kitasatospora aureofaciens]
MPNYSRTVGNGVSETTTDAHASTVVDLPAERAPHPLKTLRELASIRRIRTVDAAARIDDRLHLPRREVGVGGPVTPSAQ